MWEVKFINVFNFQAEVELQAPLQAFKPLLRYVYSGNYHIWSKAKAFSRSGTNLSLDKMIERGGSVSA